MLGHKVGTFESNERQMVIWDLRSMIPSLLRPFVGRLQPCDWILSPWKFLVPNIITINLKIPGTCSWPVSFVSLQFREDFCWYHVSRFELVRPVSCVTCILFEQTSADTKDLYINLKEIRHNSVLWCLDVYSQSVAFLGGQGGIQQIFLSVVVLGSGHQSWKDNQCIFIQNIC